MAWYRTGGENSFTPFLPTLEIDTGFRLQQIIESTTPTITYESLPTSQATGWTRMGSVSYWLAIANVKNKSNVVVSNSSYFVAFGITYTNNAYVLTKLTFSSNKANVSSYDYVLVQSTNRTANPYLWFE